MKYNISKTVTLMLTLLFIFNSAPLLAEERYVSDRLEITMRSGQGSQFKIIRMLKSGTPLELIEQDKSSGYSLMRTKRGTEGWVLNRYLMRTPAARTQLEQIKKQQGQLSHEKKKLAKQQQEGEDHLKNLEQSSKKLLINNRSLSKQLEEIHKTASSALAINNENKTLKARLMKIEREQQTLQQEYSALKDRTDRDWFMIGAGVLLLGIIAGLILPRFQWRRRHQDWGSL
ncbi:MAG: TIGR04211 family SH3 domain-containing protein [Gammaproteobacteria bacterium]|nr:TIGR04211 family SH3 domain-containing protein [Gammaproteobacteria bacterium]